MSGIDIEVIILVKLTKTSLLSGVVTLVRLHCLQAHARVESTAIDKAGSGNTRWLEVIIITTTGEMTKHTFDQAKDKVYPSSYIQSAPHTM